MKRARLRADDDGASLVLAILFILVVGVIGGALVTFAGGGLTQSVTLGADRSQTFAAESAVQVAIQTVRNLNTQSTAPGYLNQGNGTINACPDTTVSTQENGALYSPQTESVVVMCAVGQAPVPFQRSITFAACPSGTPPSSCLTGQSAFAPKPQSGALVVATTTFYDLKNGCTGLSAGCPLAPGTSVDVARWVLTGADD